MPTFRFMIEEILSSIADFEGPVIAGRVLDTSDGLQVGDWLNIKTPLRQIPGSVRRLPADQLGATRELGLDRGGWASVRR